MLCDCSSCTQVPSSKCILNKVDSRMSGCTFGMARISPPTVSLYDFVAIISNSEGFQWSYKPNAAIPPRHQLLRQQENARPQRSHPFGSRSVSTQWTQRTEAALAALLRLTLGPAAKSLSMKISWCQVRGACGGDASDPPENKDECGEG